MYIWLFRPRITLNCVFNLQLHINQFIDMQNTRVKPIFWTLYVSEIFWRSKWRHFFLPKNAKLANYRLWFSLMTGKWCYTADVVYCKKESYIYLTSTHRLRSAKYCTVSDVTMTLPHQKINDWILYITFTLKKRQSLNLEHISTWNCNNIWKIAVWTR